MTSRRSLGEICGWVSFVPFSCEKKWFQAHKTTPKTESRARSVTFRFFCESIECGVHAERSGPPPRKVLRISVVAFCSHGFRAKIVVLKCKKRPGSRKLRSLPLQFFYMFFSYITSCSPEILRAIAYWENNRRPVFLLQTLRGTTYSGGQMIHVTFIFQNAREVDGAAGSLYPGHI